MSRYREYLASDEWREKRAAVMKRSRGKCELCGAVATQVHHVQYPKRYGQESLKSLLAVCDPCHCKSHGIVRAPKMKFEIVEVKTFDGQSMRVADAENGHFYVSAEGWAAAIRVPKSLSLWFAGRLERSTSELNNLDAMGEWEADLDGRLGYRWQVVARSLRAFHADGREKYWNVRTAPVGEVDQFELYRGIETILLWGDGLAEQELKRRYAEIVEAKEESKPVTEWDVLRQMFLTIGETVERVDEHEKRLQVLETTPEKQSPVRDAKEYITVQTRFYDRSMNVQQRMPGRRQPCHNAVGVWCAKNAEAFGVNPGDKVYEGLSDQRATMVNTWPCWYIDKGIAEVMGE